MDIVPENAVNFLYFFVGGCQEKELFKPACNEDEMSKCSAKVPHREKAERRQ
jgi:hypothetical protein